LTNRLEGYYVIKLLLLILIFGALAQAQAPDAPRLTPGAALTLTLDGQGPVVATFTADSGDRVTLTAQALDELDTTLELLGPNGRRVAFNDDHGTDAAALAASDSRITRLTLDQAGDYVVRVDSFNGVTAGDVRLTLDVPPPPDAAARDVLLLRGEALTIPLALDAGDRLTVTLSDPRGLRDPLLRLVAPDGALIGANDDHTSADLTLNLFDARLDVTVDAAGEYRLELREFLGRGGLLALEIAINPTG
jgi:hypothetical protein